jgi:hypothetical protein
MSGSLFKVAVEMGDENIFFGTFARMGVRVDRAEKLGVSVRSADVISEVLTLSVLSCWAVIALPSVDGAFNSVLKGERKGFDRV